MSKLPILAAAVLAGFAVSSSAATKDLGNLTDTASATQNIIYAGIFGASLQPGSFDRFEFDLDFASDVTIEIYSRLALTIGAEFDLYDNTNTLIDSKALSGATQLGTVSGLSLGLSGGQARQNFQHSQLTFSDVAAGTDYQFRFDPGVFTLAVGYRVQFAGSTLATPMPPTPAVPEPQTYALVAAGLGVVGFLSRRRRAAQA